MEPDPTRAPDPPAPRRPAFRGDAHFRDDRFDDERIGASYGHVPIADALTADDRPLADPWTRLGAYLLDIVFGLVALAPGVVLVGVLGGFSGYDGPAVVGIVLGGLAFLGFAGYQIYLLATEGQSLGKRALKLRIVDVDDGSNPGFVRAFLLRGVVPGVIGAVPLVGSFFSLANVLFIFRDDRRCIHDHFAKTVVVTEAGSTY